MTKLRKIAIAVAVLLTASAIGVGSHFKRLADRHRDQVQLELRRLLGDSVRFDGLEVRLLWLPGFVLREFRVADDSRFAATPMVKARELVLGISLSQLFTGHMVIDSMTFVTPELQIITDETGVLNLSMLAGRRKELGAIPRRRSSTPGERRQSAVRFAIDEIRVDDGRIIYLDRTAKDPAEMQLRNVDLQISGLDLAQPTRVRLAASLTEGLGQDLRVEGALHGVKADQSWYQRGMDLKVEFDSLHAPMLLRAFSGLRDRIPREFDVTGPMALRAQASGTILRPRLDDVTLKIPLFGATDYNAFVTGKIAFTEQRTWSDAQLDGRLKISPLALSRARLLPALRDHLPKELIAEGNVSFYSRFEGSWNYLRMGVLVRAENSEIRYRDWLRKAANSPAEIKMRLSRRNQRLTIHESELTLGGAKTAFSGAVGDIDAPRLYLKLKGEDAPLAVWTPFSNGALTAKSGRASWHLAFERTPAAAPAWHVEGQLTIADGEVQGRDDQTKVEQLNAQVTFLGQQARLDRASFRLGGAALALTATMPSLSDAKVDYHLTAPEIDLASLPALAIAQPVTLRQLTVTGQLENQDNGVKLTGDAAAAQGSFNGFALNDLRSRFSWSAAGFSFNDLTFRAAQGTLRADGSRSSASAETAAHWDGAAEIKGAELPPLLEAFLPLLKDRLNGNLSGQAKYQLTPNPKEATAQVLTLGGEATIRDGVIKDFNLLSQLLLRGSGSSVSAAAKARLPAALIELAKHNDTSFDALKANFTLDKGRLSSDNLILTTADYTVTGAGWFAPDRTTRWNGLLVLSPRLTQEIQRDYRWMRHLLDRRGRLAIPFRIDGTIPNVRVRIENRNLSQALRGTQPRDRNRDSADDRPPKEEKSWLPDAIDRFFNR